MKKNLCSKSKRVNDEVAIHKVMGSEKPRKKGLRNGAGELHREAEAPNVGGDKYLTK